MSSGQWEVVGPVKKPKPSNGDVEGKAAKSSQNGSKGAKAVQKKLPTPRDAARSLQKFKINMNQEEEKEDEDFFKQDIAAATKSQKSSNKKLGPTKPKTLKDAVTKLNLSELQSLVKVVRSQFADNPLIWLKDVASFLNVRLNPSTPVDSAYRQEQSQSAPLDYLSIPIREFLVRLVQSCNTDVLSQFHRHCFVSMLNEAVRGEPVHGFAIFIQVVGNVCREACSVHAQDYIKFRETYDNHPRPGLTYVWLLSHAIASAAGAKQYSSAVTMWMEGLLPLVTLKQYSALVTQSGKDLTGRMEGLVGRGDGLSPGSSLQAGRKGKQTKNISNNKQVVTCEQLLVLLEVAFAPVTQIPRAINKQLGDIFNRFKVVCCSSSESSAVFKQLLPKLTAACSPTMAQQVSSTCSYCLLNTDSNCWDLWQSMLPKHQLQSAKLLKLLASEESSQRALLMPAAQPVLAAMEQSSGKQAGSNAQARELHRELQRVQSSVAASLNEARQASASRAGACTGGFISRTLRLLLLTVLMLTAVGYLAQYLDNNKDTFSSSLPGKLVAKAGLTEPVLLATAKMAALSRTVWGSCCSQWGRVSAVVAPYVTVLRARSFAVFQGVQERFPGAAAAVMTAAQRCLDAALAAWAAARPLMLRVMDVISTTLSSENLSSAVLAATNYTAQLLDAVRGATGLGA